MAKKPALSVVRSNAASIQPTRKLNRHGMALWNAVQREFRVDDVGGLELLQQACGGVDRLEAISARIDEDGEIIRTRNGLRSHPLIREETALRALVCRTLEKLGITQEKIKSPGRPGRPAFSRSEWRRW